MGQLTFLALIVLTGILLGLVSKHRNKKDYYSIYMLHKERYNNDYYSTVLFETYIYRIYSNQYERDIILGFYEIDIFLGMDELVVRRPKFVENLMSSFKSSDMTSEIFTTINTDGSETETILDCY